MCSISCPENSYPESADMETALANNPLLAQSVLFRGPEERPFLAPRGIWTVAGKLFVADTGQNRVFIWHQMPKETYASADVVLGQDLQAATGRNAGEQVSAATLQYPSGIWSDGQRLVVADAWNHRVLIWHNIPTQNGQPADTILGQPVPDTNQPNVDGISASPTAQTLHWPYGVHSDGRCLWIADTGNRRVLYFDHIPTHNFTAATAVIGQPDFTQKDYDSQNAIWPYSVRVSPNGSLAITDTQYFRVLLWYNWKDAFNQPADRLIGQATFTDNGQNQYRLQPGAHTLNWCYDSCFLPRSTKSQESLWVADTGNSRLLWYPNLEGPSNPAAADLLGHADFYTGSENQNTLHGTENALYWPFALCVDGQTMAIADTGNHRVVLYDLTKNKTTETP